MDPRRRPPRRHPGLTGHCRAMPHQSCRTGTRSSGRAALHPDHAIGYVHRGTIRFHIGEQPERLLTAGDAFHEPSRAHVPHFDNGSRDEPAVFLACHLPPEGED
jgi:hypothetical protein